MTTRFIADLHLEESRPDITEAFLGFLPAYAHNIDALYILGDFFEAWIGDDERTPLQETVAEALQAVTASGTALYLMHGNRDFLIGREFCDRVGATLLDDPTLIDLHGEPTLLMHGDSLCTADEEYQKFRANMRNPQWQKAFLQRPLSDRQTVARQMREISQAKNRGKEQTIMDVTPEEVVADMEHHGVQQLIHGHTHRPKVHELEANGAPARRYVTGDWHEKAWYIEAREGASPELLSIPFDELTG
ncbi:MAG: UDP-2,3-diacylglucosamine diphosphatase [Pseudomonadota bacterium]